MDQTITLQLPAETLQRYRESATVARKALEEFLVERLVDAVPPLADDLPFPLHEDLKVRESTWFIFQRR